MYLRKLFIYTQVALYKAYYIYVFRDRQTDKFEKELGGAREGLEIEKGRGNVVITI